MKTLKLVDCIRDVGPVHNGIRFDVRCRLSQQLELLPRNLLQVVPWDLLGVHQDQRSVVPLPKNANQERLGIVTTMAFSPPPLMCGVAVTT